MYEDIAVADHPKPLIVTGFVVDPVSGSFDEVERLILPQDRVSMMDIGGRTFAVLYDERNWSCKRPAPSAVNGADVVLMGTSIVFAVEGTTIRELDDDSRRFLTDNIQVMRITDAKGSYTTYCLQDCRMVPAPRKTSFIGRMRSWLGGTPTTVPPNHIYQE